ncbi:MAG: calcium-translocating P-type ATPase, PMCA-type [Clostridiales bacterium]|nr:calcium-translocating P-type ATPase, PMCA-type [Clostridiales bacterium]
MNAENLTVEEALKEWQSRESGLKTTEVKEHERRWGKNQITPVKQKSLFFRILEGLTEPMMIILLVALGITVTVNIIKASRGDRFDYIECIGIVAAIVISTTITVIMEGRSVKAFDALKRMGADVPVKVMRDGSVCKLKQSELVAGDVVLFETGDKIPVDCRLIKSAEFSVDESPLTGESHPVRKNASAACKEKTPLAERKNMVYGGCYVTEGSAVALVTAVGDATEIGKIAGTLAVMKAQPTPLQHKLDKLGKVITIAGACAAAAVFLIRLFTLIAAHSLSFDSVQEIFITSIVLIVASVPEGLPTIVAVSLALNVIKMAKQNALVKKMAACETVGSVSVICSDKTGTLTENRMTVGEIYCHGKAVPPQRADDPYLLRNFAINTTANIGREDGKETFVGSPTECALLAAYEKTDQPPYERVRAEAEIIYRYAFSSEEKRMTTVVREGSTLTAYCKGAPERVLALCEMNADARKKIEKELVEYEAQAKRVLAFAHGAVAKGVRFESERSRVERGLVFDGFAVISDPVRKEVYAAVEACREAGVRVKMLTGDNAVTARAIARELKIITRDEQVFTAMQIEEMSEEELRERLPDIGVVARSTPQTKLRIVNALMAAGEVVAVTGDGINDAPAIKNADIGIAMGITGTEVSKEASDIVLLDDSFSTIVKSVQWGRGIYENFQRFILFQLSVNISAVLLTIIFSLIPGGEPPFNALELLWVNLIMDGPPALSLGLAAGGKELMNRKPVRRNSGIVTQRMLGRILANALFIAGMLLLQARFNFLRVAGGMEKSVMFTAFVLFQLFNAVNARELGTRSVFAGLNRNRIMWIVMAITFGLQILITQFGSVVFDVAPLDVLTWGKVLALSASVILFNELYKLVFRQIRRLRCKAETE